MAPQDRRASSAFPGRGTVIALNLVARDDPHPTSLATRMLCGDQPPLREEEP
jgi:hypothetical protein